MSDPFTKKHSRDKSATERKQVEEAQKQARTAATQRIAANKAKAAGRPNSDVSPRWWPKRFYE